MLVKVGLSSFLRIKIGLPQITVALEDNSSIEDLVKKLGELYGSEVADYLTDKRNGWLNALFVVNKKQCNKDMMLKDGDSVSIFPPIAGG